MIASDGNIYTLDPTVTLRYDIQDGYMSIRAEKSSAIIATILYKIDAFYTTKDR
jgi:hypothetical protein